MAARKWNWGEAQAMDALKSFVDEFRAVDIWNDGCAVTALSAWAGEEAERAARAASEDANKKCRQ